MILPDVNILIDAFRPEHAAHERCRRFLIGLGRASEAFALSPVVLSGFIRIVTNPRIYVDVERPDVAFEFCARLLATGNAVLVNPRERHWGIFEDLCRRTGARGNLVPDAWFAALAIEWNCEWVTLDRDFALFDDLRWSEPPA